MTVRSPELDVSTKQRVIDAAGRTFAAKGFEQATVREICKAAAANIASVNYYFRDKAGLYAEAVRQAHEWRIAKAAMPDWPNEAPAESKLYDFITTQLTRVLLCGPEHWQTQLIMREAMSPTPHCGVLAAEGIRPQFEMLKSILQELAGGVLADDVLHRLVFSVVGQWLFYRIGEHIIPTLLRQPFDPRHHVPTLARHITCVAIAAAKSAAAENGGAA